MSARPPAAPPRSAATPRVRSAGSPGEGRGTLWEIAASVLDPEVPVLTIEDLGILRDVEADASGRVTVVITPTYSGCPAIDAIRRDLLEAFAGAGYRDVDVELTLSPAWTTDWMTEQGKRKLEEFGIAPPGPRGSSSSTASGTSGPVDLALSVRCPRCGSPDTRELSRFGSTACKSLWVCRTCAEPFDHFKAH